MTSTPPTARKRGPGLVLSLAVLVIGLIVGVVSWIAFARPFIHEFNDSPRITRSGPVVLQLDKGHYLIYDRYGPGEQPSQVAITGPDGEDVHTSTPIPNETFSRDGHSYTGALRFDASRSGEYSIAFRQERVVDVVVARTFGDTFHNAFPWLPTAIIGSLSFIAGIALLVIGIVRRRTRPGNSSYW